MYLATKSFFPGINMSSVKVFCACWTLANICMSTFVHCCAWLPVYFMYSVYRGMFCLANFVLRQHLRESYPGKQGEKQRENRHSHSGRQAGRQTDRQAVRQAGRQAGRQTGRLARSSMEVTRTNKLTDIETRTHSSRPSRRRYSTLSFI